MEDWALIRRLHASEKLPKAVIADARRTLASLERDALAGGRTRTGNNPINSSPQLGLFAPTPPSKVEAALRDIDPDALSPREALEALYRLKSIS